MAIRRKPDTPHQEPVDPILAQNIVRSIMETSTDILFVKDLGLRMLLCCDKLAGTIGKRPQELYGRTDIEGGWDPDFVKGNPEKGIPGWEQDDLDAIAGRVVRRRSEGRTKLDASSVSDIVKIPLKDGSGTTIGMLGIARDMTDEDARMKEMAEIVSSSEDAVFSMMLDGTICSWNPAAERISGFPAEAVIGTRTSFLDPSVVPDLFREVRGGAPVRQHEVETLRADGSPVPLSLTISPIRDSIGTVRRACVIARDISQRREAERRLRESEERWRAIVSTSPDGVLVVSPAGVIEQASPRVLELWRRDSMEQVVGRPMTELLAPECHGQAAEFLEQTLRGARQGSRELIARGRAGGGFPVEVSGGVLSRPGGGSPSVVAFFRDRTEHNRLEQRFLQVQKMEAIGRLAGGVAHDFNNMLEVIMGNAEMAIEQAEASGAVVENLQQILKAAQRSADLTRKLLAFSRKQAVVPRVLDLNETVASLAGMLRRLIGEDVELCLDHGPDLWTVRADPGQVDQVMVNLVVNARDAIQGAGKITVRTRNVAVPPGDPVPPDDLPPGEYVLVSVEDTGAGMTQETLSHLFEPFFTTKEMGKGTGLGLATVYGAVQQNHGLVKASSRLGEGTSFRIYLPRANGAAELPRAATSASPRGMETILLVEDEEAILKLAANALQRRGYTVLAAGSPKVALDLAARHPGPIHLLVTDLVMPVMDGKRLRDRLLEARTDLKTLFMSGYSSDVLSSEGVMDEGFELLQKPFSMKAFAERVRQVLNGG